MTLEEKGTIMPPPVLSGAAGAVNLSIQSWKGVISASHWDLYDRSKVDGADYYVGAEELGHIHLDGEVHLTTPVALRNALLAAGLAKKFPYGDDWVMYPIRTKADAAHAEWLFRLRYDQLNGASQSELLERIAAYR